MSWSVTRLSDVLSDARPGFASGKDEEGGILQIRMNNLTRDGTLDYSKTRRVPSSERNIINLLLQPGDVLFNATNSLDLVGKTAYFDTVDEPTTFSNHFIRLRPNDARLVGRYLTRWLQLQFNRKLFRAMAKQWVNQATVSREALLSLKIPLPSVIEQCRVAMILEQADTLRVKRREALTRLDELTQSVFMRMFGDPATNPRKFAMVRLGDLTEVGTGSTPSRCSEQNFNGSTPWVKTTEVDGEIILDTKEKISDIGLKKSRCKTYPEGSIVIALYGQGKTRGRCAILGIRAATNQACAVLPPSSTFDKRFLLSELRILYSRLRSLGRGGSQANLNLKLIADFEVIVPPLELQQEFAVQVEAVERLKEQHRVQLAELDALFASLQYRAFRGEL